MLDRVALSALAPNSSTSTSNFYPTQDEGCVKAGECNLPYLEQMRGWTATGGPLSADPIPDDFRTLWDAFRIALQDQDAVHGG